MTGVNPMLAPVRRSQSPTSTANPKAVNVETPRRQPKRYTTGVSSLSAAIATSRRSRRWVLEGAAISHLIPVVVVVNARANPYPVGPAS